MHIIIVDDEQMALGDLMNKVGTACPDSHLQGFRNAKGALEYLSQNPADTAFLDIAMPGMNGLELAKRIKEMQPNTNIIFVTAHSEYALDAHKLYVTGYLMKPATPEDIRIALEHLCKPSKPMGSRIKVRTFGGFDVYVDGNPLRFGHSKAKELLAYLIDRKGFSSTMSQIFTAIWEDTESAKTQKTHLRRLIAEMMRVLKSVGAEDMVIKGFNSLRVDTTRFDCDYYDFLGWKLDGVNAYTSEYMPEYSWAEFTFGALKHSINEKSKREPISKFFFK